MLKVKYSDLKYNDYTALYSSELYFSYGINVIIGENGSGKTSFLNMLYGQFPEVLEEVEINNNVIDISDISKFRNSFITYVSQQNILFEKLDVKSNLALIAPNYNGDNLSFLASKLNFQQVLDANSIVKKLSGGEKQKLKIICGLLSKKPILILDEPFNNLDNDAILFLMNYLREIKRCLIITSHLEIDGEYNTIVINQGKVASVKMVDADIKVGSVQENRTLFKADLKKLAKINSSNRVSLYIVNGLLMIGLLFAISNATNIYKQARVDRSNFIFADNASLVSPPLFNSYFTVFGDQSWLGTVPSLFSDEDVEKIANLPYVTSVVPTKNRNYDVGSNSYQGKYILDLPTTDNEDYTFTTNLYSQQVAQGIPRSYFPLNNGQLGDVIIGTFPQDKSNEVMIDEAMADYLLDNSKYTSLEQVVDKEIQVPVLDVNTDSKTKLSLKISGVVSLDRGFDNNITAGTVISSFDPTDTQSVGQSYSQYKDPDIIVDSIKTKYEIAGLDTQSVQLNQIPSPGYDTLYIETKESADVERLTKDLTKYDKYIEVENNYTNSNSFNFTYLNSIIVQSMLIVLALLLIFILCLVAVIKLYKRSITNTCYTLSFYGYNDTQSEMFIKFDTKEYILNTIVMSLLVGLGLTYLYPLRFGVVSTSVLIVLIALINVILIKVLINIKYFKEQ